MAIVFSNTTNSSGLAAAFPTNSFGTFSSAWGRLNGDRFPDLWDNNHFLQTGTDPIRNLFLNQGDGTFTDIAQTNLLPETDLTIGDFHGAAWIDFDNDGDQDLLQIVAGENAGENLPPDSEPNRFYVNNGGILTDQASSLGVSYDSARAQTAVFFDFNNDGLLDFFHGAEVRGDGLTPPTVFQQQANNTFVDVGSSVLPGNIQTDNNLFGVLSDVSGDGTLDLILPNNSRVVLDTTTPTFTDITSSITSNTNLFNNAADIAAADFNGDLLPDLYITRGGADRLAINGANGLTDQASASGISVETNTFGRNVVAGDFDNDMDVDIFVVRQQNIFDPNGNLPDVLYENQGDGTFTVVPDAGGANGPEVGVGDQVVTADYDLNGTLDIFVSNSFNTTEGSSELYSTQSNGNNWIQLDLVGVDSNRDGIGAQIFVTAGGVTQLREQSGGIHRTAQNLQRIHFGLADNTTIEQIEIRWPSGNVQQIQNVNANQLLEVVEENNVVVTPNDPIAENDTASTDADTAVNIDVLANDVDPDGDPLTLSIDTAPSNGTAVVNDNGTPNNLTDDSIAYTPNSGFSGNDQFTYQVDDGNGGTDTATVTVTVHGVIDGGDNIINGDEGDNNIIGTSEDDVINGLGGNDNLRGTSGNDTVNGGDGNDRVQGQVGNDVVTGGNGQDTLQGWANNDILIGGDGNDELIGGSGGDLFRYENLDEGVDTIVDFAPGEDIIAVNSSFGGDLTTGTLEPGQFVVSTTAQDSSDRFIYDLATGELFFDPDGTGSSNQVLIARLSNQANLTADSIMVESSTSTGQDNQNPIANDDNTTTDIDTGTTIDVLSNDSDPDGDPLTMSIDTTPTNGTAVVDDNGTPGNLTDDFIIYTPNSGFAGNDQFTYQINDGNGGVNTATVTIAVDDAGNIISGTPGNDNIIGTNGDDVINGLGGNDNLRGTLGNDTVNGGDGNDRVQGQAGDDVLYGGSGVDTLQGWANNDILVGNEGNDELIGGNGSDIFQYENSNQGVDIIVDLVPGQDSIGIDSSFGGGLTVGTLDPNQFTVSTTAQDSSDRFIYNSGTGDLFFDPDGNNGENQILIARLSNQASLSASDILIN